MSTYSGQFRVTNDSTLTIYGQVVHTAGDFPSATVDFSSGLQPGASTGYVPFSTSSGSTDTWSYAFNNGSTKWQSYIDCGFESEDQTVDVVLTANYVLVIPSSSKPDYDDLEDDTSATAAAAGEEAAATS